MEDVPKGDWYCESCTLINQNVDRLDYVKRKKRKLARMKYYEDLSDSEEVSIMIEPESTSSDDDERLERLRRKRRRMNEANSMNATVVQETQGEEGGAVRAQTAETVQVASGGVHKEPAKHKPAGSTIQPSAGLQAGLDAAQLNISSARTRPRSIVEETLLPNAACHFEVVKTICGRRLRGGELQYKVKWIAQDREPSWVYAATMRECENLLSAFETKYADLIRQKTEQEAKK
jgi:hypothetical protein